MNIFRGLLSVFRSVAFKIIVVNAVVIATVAAIVSALVYSHVQDQGIAQITENMRALLIQQERQLDIEFTTTKNLVKTIAHDQEVIAFLSAYKADEQDQSQLFLEDEHQERKEHILSYLQSYNAAKQYESIYLLDSTGLTLVSTQRSFEGNNFQFREYFQLARSDKVVVSTGLGAVSLLPGYYFSYPIYNPDDLSELLGVAVIKFGAENIEKIIAYTEGLDVYLLDSESVIVFTTQEALLLKSFIHVPELYKLIGQRDSKYLGMEIVALEYEDAWATLTQSEGIVEMQVPDLQKYGQNSVVLGKHIGESGYFFLLAATDEFVTSEISLFASDVSFRIFVAALLAFMILSVLVYLFLNPMNKISRVVQSIASGNYDSQIEVKTYDEFEDIATSLQVMQEKIQKEIEEAKQISEERKLQLETKISELEKLNESMVNRELELVKLKNQLRKQGDTNV